MTADLEAAEADFAREYPGICGGDLRRAMYGPDAIGVRRLNALITKLPSRSQLMSANFSDGTEWGNLEELLALNCELQDTTNRLIFGAHYKGHVWKPLHIKRPTEKVPTLASPNEIHRFFTANKGVLGDVRVTQS